MESESMDMKSGGLHLMHKGYVVTVVLFVLISLSFILFVKDFNIERYQEIDQQRVSDCVDSYLDNGKQLSERYFDSIGIPFERYIEGVFVKCGAVVE